ncbi:MAG: carboxypeptidase-like regulatory domain-containing protein, partial [Lutimonas sp.]
MKNFPKFLGLILFFTGSVLFAQTKISGKVNDENGSLPGANVVVKGTTNGTTTDFDGNFSLEVNNGKGVLEISFVGLAKKD